MIYIFNKGFIEKSFYIFYIFSLFFFGSCFKAMSTPVTSFEYFLAIDSKDPSLDPISSKDFFFVKTCLLFNSL